MCIEKKQLAEKINSLKTLKMLKEETEAEIRHLEKEIIEFLNETEECGTVDKKGNPIRQFIGVDYKATYSMTTREGINKEAVKELLGVDGFLKVRTESTYGVLRIK